MASGGRDKWQKYFASEDVDTITQKHGKTNTTAAFNKKSGAPKQLPIGTPILVLKMDTYDSDIRVLYQGELGTININYIQKPNVAAAKQLGIFKPQKYNITDTKLSIDDYVSRVLAHINDNNNKNITGDLANYLVGLIDYYVGNTTLGKLKNLWRSNFPVRDINNDFGEIMGPIALFKSDIGKSKGLTFSNVDKIWVPEAPNEPLMDYGIYKGNDMLTFSAKSLATKQTNTVKCQDIINLLCKPDSITGRQTKLCLRHKDTLQYKLLELLCEHTMVQGGYAIGNHLLSKGYKTDFEGLDNYNAIAQLKGDATKLPHVPGEPMFMEKYFKYYMDKNNIPQDERTPIGVLYGIEKKIAAITKSRIKFNQLFADAVHNQVIYIKFAVKEHLNGKLKRVMTLLNQPEFF